MSRSSRALQVALVAALLAAVAVLAGPRAAAQLCGDPPLPCPETTTTTEPTTTSSSTTTSSTTVAPSSTSSTTAAPRTTTTAPRATTTTAASASGSEEPTTTTAPVPLLAEGPPVTAGADGVVSTTISTEPVVDESGDEGRTSRQVTLVVTALLVLAAVFGLLTYWYWRRTAPSATRSVASS